MNYLFSLLLLKDGTKAAIKSLELSSSVVEVMINRIKNNLKTPSNRLEQLKVEWVESGFSPELISICSNTPFVKNLESISPIINQESFGKELDEH